MKKRFKISNFLGSLVLFTAASGGIRYYVGNSSFDSQQFVSILLIVGFSLIVSFGENDESKHDD